MRPVILRFNEKYNVLTELKIIKLLNPVCIFGKDESLELRTHFSSTGTKVETLPGSHHYGSNYKAVAEMIYKDFTQGKK